MKPSERIAEIIDSIAKRDKGYFNYQTAMTEAFLKYLDEEHEKRSGDE